MFDILCRQSIKTTNNNFATNSIGWRSSVL